MLNRSKKIRLFICVAVYIALSLFIGMARRIFGDSIDIGDLRISTNSVIGTINSFQIIICFAMVIIDYKWGWKISYVLMVVSLISCIRSMAILNSFDSLPGVVMILAGLLFVIALSSRLHIIDKNNEQYRINSITDSLTGIYNRRHMRVLIQEKIDQKKPFYLIFLNLDNFKYINDSVGHAVGDSILKTVAKRAKAYDNANGFVARNGGDEFIILIRDKNNIDIVKKAEELVANLCEDISINENRTVKIYASAGISHYPKDADNVDDVINFADTAMYEAKKTGKNSVCMFNRNIVDKYMHEKDVEAAMRKGIKKENFFLMYQPQFETKTHKLRGFEALIRLTDDNGKTVSPGEFIPIAEQSDLIIDIDRYVLSHALRQFKDAVVNAQGKFYISINISAKHISDSDLVADIQKALEETGYPPECLEIEITEYCMIRDMDKAINTVRRLHEMGIAIAIDDFGTGYASLSNLKELPVNLLKIDKSFVDNLGTSSTNDDFVAAIVSMGHLLHCEIISEGVETKEQLEILKDRNCDMIQGYIWGKPLLFEDALEVIKAY